MLAVREAVAPDEELWSAEAAGGAARDPQSETDDV
jgi:hypothetical protein